MFFAAFVGLPAHAPAWRDEFQRYAAWLGLSAHPFCRSIADGRIFVFGWASTSAPDAADLVRDEGGRVVIVPLDTPTGDVALSDELPRGFRTDATRVEISLQSGEVHVAVPVATLEKFYYARGAGGWILGNDLRFLIRMAGLDLDERGVYAIFQYGAIPSPLTVSRSVRRIMPGHVLTLPADSGDPRLRTVFRFADLLEDRGERSADEYVLAAMDAGIARAEPPVAVHFSGGVDSALIAARLAALGRRDARLQRFTPGPSDSFHRLSRDMAAHLGLPLEEVYWDPAQVAPILQTVAREYGTPFADPAALPTLMLVRAMARWPVQPTAVLAGTGAQSLFVSGIKAPKFRMVYGVPRMLRRLVGAAYTRGLWRSTSKLAWFVGAVNKSAALPVEYAATGSHSSVEGLAFHMPPDVSKEVEDTALAEIDALAGGAGLAERISVAGIVRNSLCRCGQRPFDPLRRRGIRTILPYVQPETVRAAFSLSWDEKSPNHEPKGLLKALLARQVPREWVYVPKGRFLLPYREAFAHPATREYVRDVVLAPVNPVLALCDAENVRAIFRRLEAGAPMHRDVFPFAWAVTFLTAWLEGVREGLRGA